MSAAQVPFGFAWGSGKPVTVPLRHMVITGQTQEAGKTTALEALVARSGVQAIAFVTKRGEASFATARRIPPYFREKTDWRYVAAVLEASEGQKLKFERPWIMRATKGATTLADVRANVQRLGKDAKGMNADMYLVLDAYLETVVPEIARTRWASTVELAPGMNVMDLGGLKDEMQQLVIRSTIEWVLAEAHHTVIVIPEAWKFIPQGRGTPVKLEAEAFIRQGAALRNYLWLDSQDIAGVEKTILKSVPLWILGVQRETNEIQRTLAQIPGAKQRIRPEQIATLGLGQFYVCHGEHVTHTYAQPAWMGQADAQLIAQGRAAVGDVRATYEALATVGRTPLQAPRGPVEEDQVNATEAQELRDRNEQLREENDHFRERIAALEQQVGELLGRNGKPAPAPPSTVTRVELPPGFRFPSSEGDADFEPFYQALKRRLSADAPQLLKVLVTRPELDVSVQRTTVAIDGATPKGRIARLLADGFFAEPRAPGQVQAELARRGKDPGPRIVDALRELAEAAFFLIGSGRDSKSRVTTTYQAAPGMRVRTREIEA